MNYNIKYKWGGKYMLQVCLCFAGWHVSGYGHRQQCRWGGGWWEQGQKGQTLCWPHKWRCHGALCLCEGCLCPLLSLWYSAWARPWVQLWLRAGLCLFPEGWWEAQLLAPLQPQGPPTQWLGLWFGCLPSRVPAPRNAERQRYSHC